MQNFEQKINSAKEKLEKLSNPEITLKESLELYKSGMTDLKEAQKMLEDAKLEYEILKSGKEDQ